MHEGNNPDPGASLVLMVPIRASEPKSFLTSNMNSAVVIPNIKLVHLIGSYVVALAGQLGGLNRHTFRFVGKQVGDQLPSTLFKPTNGGALVAFQMVEVDVLSEVVVNAH